MFKIIQALSISGQKVIRNNLKWFLFSLLCIIWGSSFILMKLGMFAIDGSPLLSPLQVAAIRILTSGIVLIPFALKAFSQIPKDLRKMVLFSGWLGSFIPAILFCVAELKIDSALAGTLNAVTPLSTLVIGWAFFKIKIPASKISGVLIGFAGCSLLFFLKPVKGNENSFYGLLVIAATLCYGWNALLVKQHLTGVSSLSIAAAAFTGLIPFSFALLVFTGYFSLPLHSYAYIKASSAATLLGVLGTAFASVIFYRLVKMAGPVFASLVTYGIPFVAIAWGFIYGESIGVLQVVALGFILAGVYLVNKK